MENEDVAMAEAQPQRNEYTYKIEWEQIPEFHEWLRPVQGQATRARCLFCNKSFFAKLQIIRKHFGCGMHQRNAENAQNLNGENANNEVHNLRPVEVPRTYRIEWEQMPEFREWLSGVPNQPTLAQCLFCEYQFNARIHIIRDHSISDTHRREFLNRLPEDANVIDFLNNDEIIDRKVHRAEMKIAAVFAEHNLAFLLADCLIPVLKHISDDRDCREIWSRLSMNRKDVPKIIKNCIAEGYKNDLARKLRETKFSVLFDESVDVSQSSNYCIVVMYPDDDLRKIVTTVWEVAKVRNDFDDIHVAGAGVLFDLIVDSFNKYNIPLQNVGSFGSDGCNTMMAANNSLAQRFLARNPNVNIIKCPCHSLNLCAETAIKEIPGDLPQMFSKIHAFFSRSPKRQHQLIQFQAYLDAEINKILGASSIRWLSTEQCVKRFLEQWLPLQDFFTDQFLNDNIASAEPMFNFFQSPVNKCYLKFLNKINIINKFLQNKEIVIHRINSCVTGIYKEILKMYMQENHVDLNNISEIDPMNQNEYLRVEEISLGDEANAFLNLPDTAEFNVNHKNNVKYYCLQYLKKLCEQIKQRFNNFTNNFYDFTHCLSPNNTLSPDFHANNQNIIFNLTNKFRGLIQNQNEHQEIINQWNNMLMYEWPNNLRDPDVAIDYFWYEVYYFRNNAGQYPLRTLAKFALYVLTTPPSNAEPERVWSKVNLEMTRLRNKLDITTLDALLLTSYCVRLAGRCINFEPTENMFRLMRNINHLNNNNNENNN